MSSLKLILAILFIIAVCVFAVLNQNAVEVHYYDLHLHEQSISMPMILLVLGAFSMGVFMTLFFTIFGSIRLKSQVRRKNREVVSLQKDINRLKPTGASSGADF